MGRMRRYLLWALVICMVITVAPGGIEVFADSDVAEIVVGYEDSFDGDSADCYQATTSFSISGGKLTVDGDGVVGLKDKVWYNATYEFDMDLSDKSEWAGVLFDKENPTAQRDTPGYMLYVRNNGSVELYSGSRGAFAKAEAELDQYALHLKIVTEKGRICVYVNGETEPVIDASDSMFDNGYFSFVGYGGGSVSYDNLKITYAESNGMLDKIIINTPDGIAGLGAGETMQMDVQVFPLDAGKDDFLWEITDVYGNPSTLAVVSEDGYVTAGNAPGTVRISAVSKADSSVSASVELPITEKAQRKYVEPTVSSEYFNDFANEKTEFTSYSGFGSSCAIDDNRLLVTADVNAVNTLENHTWADAVFEYDMEVNASSEWAGFMFHQQNPGDNWDTSGYMFLVRPSGEYQLIAAGGDGCIAQGALESGEGKHHYKVDTGQGNILIFCDDGTEPFIDVTNTRWADGYTSFTISAGSAYIDNYKVAPKGDISEEDKIVLIDELYLSGAYGTSAVEVGDSLQINACAKPYVDMQGHISYEVKNEDGTGTELASIDENGVLKAGDQPGKVVVTATADCGAEASVVISIEDSIAAEAINVAADKGARIMGIDKTVQMRAFTYPANASDGEVGWSVFNTDGSATDLAEITDEGELTAKKEGTVRVRAALKSNPETTSEWIMTIGKITTNGKVDLESMKLSFFAHYVADLTHDTDGKLVTDPNELADAFDAEAYADKMAAMGVEYVVFTAWHYRMVVLGPSEAMKKWDMENHQTDRDLIGDMIKAVQEKGINVVLYTHPFDGYDFKTVEEGNKTGWGSGLKPQEKPNYGVDFDYDKWNDFINDVYGELMDRYGDKLAAIWCDEGSFSEGMAKAVDFPRLLKTITDRNPDIATIQNYHNFLYGFQYQTMESWKMVGLTDHTGNSMITYANRIANPVIGSDWWTTGALGNGNKAVMTGSQIFKYQVMQSAVVGGGGGIEWSAGPYPGEGCEYEDGVLESMEVMNAYLNPIAWTIKGTLASTSYETGGGRKLTTIGWGVATKSTDDSKEYIHVLNSGDKAISGNTLTLAPPADNKIFTEAYLALNNKKVTLRQDEEGVYLTLPADETWKDTDTVIELLVDTEKLGENPGVSNDKDNNDDNSNSNNDNNDNNNSNNDNNDNNNSNNDNNSSNNNDNSSNDNNSNDNNNNNTNNDSDALPPVTTGTSVYAAGIEVKAAGYLGKTITLVKGKKVSLKAKVLPSEAKTGVTFESGNAKVASVNEKGVVKARKVGKAAITICSNDKKKTVKYTIKVVKKAVRVKKITLKKTRISVKKGETYQIALKKAVSGTSRFTYSSSRKKCASVDVYGLVKGLKKGKSVITVKCGKAKSKITVTVK